MRKVFILSALVCVLAFAQATDADADADADADQSAECNPEAEGVPNCSNVESSNRRYRNNWDPTVYFICKNYEAVEVSCNGKGYNPVLEKCVPWSEWTWIAPCSTMPTTTATTMATTTTDAPAKITTEKATETTTQAPVKSTMKEATTEENVTEEATTENGETDAQSGDCDPDAEGLPNCANLPFSSAYKRYRNNWDSTKYFICENGRAVELSCNDGGFDPVKQKCVPWIDWTWTAPCSSAEETTKRPTEETTRNPIPETTTYESNECDPTAEGIPDCDNLADSRKRYRNNWNSTKYFVCENGRAMEQSCTDGGFDPTTQQCVPWHEWTWSAPCSSEEETTTKTPGKATTNSIPATTVFESNPNC